MELMSYLDINPEQEKYRLNDEQKNEYLNAVIALFTTGKSSVSEEETPEKPTLYFVSGQTGCGKTEVIKMLRKEYLVGCYKDNTGEEISLE